MAAVVEIADVDAAIADVAEVTVMAADGATGAVAEIAVEDAAMATDVVVAIADALTDVTATSAAVAATREEEETTGLGAIGAQHVQSRSGFGRGVFTETRCLTPFPRCNAPSLALSCEMAFPDSAA